MKTFVAGILLGGVLASVGFGLWILEINDEHDKVVEMITNRRIQVEGDCARNALRREYEIERLLRSCR
jgi:hypothetical protein